jgi:hypothetical protein
MRITYYILFILVIFIASACFATPSTQIWNPSTDIQARGTWHLGIDNYFTTVGPAAGGYAYPTDMGITYGLLPGLEIGLDVFLPQSSPFAFNLKYGITEAALMPALAVGGFGFGTQIGVTDQNVLYGVAAKTFPSGRLSVGYFIGNQKLLVDPSGAGDNKGIILTWDKQVNDKLWACIDYAGTKSFLGSIFYGFTWLFAPNTSIIFAYGTYHNGIKPTVTTQLDINL